MSRGPRPSAGHGGLGSSPWSTQPGGRSDSGARATAEARPPRSRHEHHNRVGVARARRPPTQGKRPMRRFALILALLAAAATITAGPALGAAKGTAPCAGRARRRPPSTSSQARAPSPGAVSSRTSAGSASRTTSRRSRSPHRGPAPDRRVGAARGLRRHRGRRVFRGRVPQFDAISARCCPR
jgi:hypothetical protein